MIEFEVHQLLIILLIAEVSIAKKCTPLVECPAMLNMLKDKPNDRRTTQILQSSRCGFEGRMPKVLCDDMDYKCKTPDSLNGTCKAIKDCKHVIKLLENMDLSDINTRSYIRSYKCNMSENNIDINVCCPEKFQTIRTLLPTPGQCGTHTPFPFCPPHHSCMKNGKRIRDCPPLISCQINGEQTRVAEFPWMALLYYQKENGVYPGCGGSLINNRYVLTAAHCLDRSIWLSLRIETLKHVVLGEYETTGDPDCRPRSTLELYNRTWTQCADPVRIIQIERYIIHPQWNKHIMQNDIALMRLKETVQFTDFIRPICLPTSDIKLEKDDGVEIAGWGKLSNTGPSSTTLMKVWLRVIDLKKCSFLKKELSDKQLCLGAEYTGRDTCQGDSGGPVMKRIVNSNKNSYFYYLVGIVSYGTRCGIRPAVYTNVIRYTNWIYQNID